MDSAKAPLWLVFQSTDEEADDAYVIFKARAVPPPPLGAEPRVFAERRRLAVGHARTLQILNIMDKVPPSLLSLPSSFPFSLFLSR